MAAAKGNYFGGSRGGGDTSGPGGANGVATVRCSETDGDESSDDGGGAKDPLISAAGAGDGSKNDRNDSDDDDDDDDDRFGERRHPLSAPHHAPVVAIGDNGLAPPRSLALHGKNQPSPANTNNVELSAASFVSADGSMRHPHTTPKRQCVLPPQPLRLGVLPAQEGKPAREQRPASSNAKSSPLNGVTRASYRLRRSSVSTSPGAEIPPSQLLASGNGKRSIESIKGDATDADEDQSFSRHTPVGDDYQADIPDLLSIEDRKRDLEKPSPAGSNNADLVRIYLAVDCRPARTTTNVMSAKPLPCPGEAFTIVLEVTPL